jgi:hypothetical protein
VRHHRCYRLLAQTSQTPRALATAEVGLPLFEDHSGSTLSWCRSRANVHGGPRANPSPMRIEAQRGNWSRAGRRLPICRARLVVTPSANPESSSSPVTCLHLYTSGRCVCSRPWVSITLACQQHQIRCRAPSFASATEKSRAAVVYPACPTARGRLLVAHHTSIDRCCASNDGRGGDGVAMPAASLSHSRGVDTATC